MHQAHARRAFGSQIAARFARGVCMALGFFMEYSKGYLRFFNFMVRRVVAVVFIASGLIGALFAIPALFDPDGTILVNGVPEHDLFYRLFAFVMPTVAAAMGVLIYRAKPFVLPGQKQ
jgi:hypothetical protein